MGLGPRGGSQMPSSAQALTTAAGCCFLASLYLSVWKPKEAKRALLNLGHVKDGIHMGQHVSHLAPQ